MKFPLYSHHIGVMGTHEPFNLAIKVLTTTSYLATWVKSWKHMESHQKPREIPPKSAFQLLRVSVQKISNDQGSDKGGGVAQMVLVDTERNAQGAQLQNASACTFFSATK